MHFLRYDPITTRVGGDPDGQVIASIAPTYSDRSDPHSAPSARAQHE